MISDTHQQLLQCWFQGLEQGCIDDLSQLFIRYPWIRNGGDGPMQGSDAPQRLLRELFERTSSRHFTIIDAAYEDRQLFVRWDGNVTLAAGFRLGSVTLSKPAILNLRGIKRFQLDARGRIEQLEIVHDVVSIETDQTNVERAA